MVLPVFPQDLLDSVMSKRIHLFIGSGASSASELIGWDVLIDEMKQMIRKECTSYPQNDLEEFLENSDFLDIAELFRQTVKDHRYFSFLRSRYRRDVKPSCLHRELSKIPVNTIFTTNYDKLLEISFRIRNGCDPAVVVYPEQLGYINNSEVRIIKLHGDIDHPSSIVLTRTDYARYASRHKDFEMMLHSSINDFTILFIGFGIRDQNFQRIYHDARSLYDSTKRTAYAIMTGTNLVQRELWEQDGLKILSVNKYSSIPTVLRAIRESTLGRST